MAEGVALMEKLEANVDFWEDSVKYWKEAVIKDTLNKDTTEEAQRHNLDNLLQSHALLITARSRL